MTWTSNARYNEYLLRRTHRCVCDAGTLERITRRGYRFLKVLERLPATGLGYVIMRAEPVTEADGDYCCIVLSLPELSGGVQYWVEQRYFEATKEITSI
jgi:hypothetical protein